MIRNIGANSMPGKETMNEQHYDLVIVGAGAAGMAAGIYGGRAGMRTAILDSKGAGGQTGVASTIENYPGFTEIEGYDLAMKFREHSAQYADILEGKTVTGIETIQGDDDVHFKLVTSDDEKYLAGAVILATGASHRKLGAPGEKEYDGKGVSYCATCDGFFFREKRVFMIGGGNTALMEAIYLKELGVNVELVHRRNEFRGEKVYTKKINDLGIPIHWDSVVEEIRGDAIVKSIVLKSTKTEETSELEANGVFVAIGILPNNKLAVALGCEIDDRGYAIVDRKQRTNIPHLYVAGDLTGGLQQVVVGGGEGAVAAMTAYTDLSHPYWA